MSRTLGLRNRQRVRAVDTRLLRRIARWALEEQLHAAEYELGLHLVTAAEMARLNQKFLDHEGSTDVITFDHGEASDDSSAAVHEPGGADLPVGLDARQRVPTGYMAPMRDLAIEEAAAGPERRAPARRGPSVDSRRAGTRRSIAVRGRRARKFSGSSLQGELFLCLDDAVAQARQFDTDWQSELARYLLHGLLHLHGFDDLTPHARRRMKREENRLLRLAERQFPLRRLARPRR